MQRKHFDPQYFLMNWKLAGGGWASNHLLRPTGEHHQLDALAAELDTERREALRQYLEGIRH